MPDQLILDLPHRTALGRDDFLVGDCNRLAVDFIDRWPEGFFEERLDEL